MYDPMIHGEVVELRKRELLRQARLHHLSRVATGEREALFLRWMALIADVLVAGGTELKRRCTRLPRRPLTMEETPHLDVRWDRL